MTHIPAVEDDKYPIKYRRVLIKISGESLMGTQPYGIDVHFVTQVAKQIVNVHAHGVDVCLVVGGGNIYRGLAASAQGMERATADYMGMLATVMNGLALSSALEKQGIETRVVSGLDIPTVCATYDQKACLNDLKKSRILIFVGGTGNPYFTTDTCAALRAAEMHCELILKGTQVDGVYSDDPKKNKDAVRYDRLTYQDVLAKNLRVMDAAAIALARESNIAIAVFSLHDERNLLRVLTHQGKFTLIQSEG